MLNIQALSTVKSWSVAWTRARCEKALERHLSTHCVTSYLPLVTLRKNYGGRIRSSQNPLFPGYVFFERTETSSRTALSSGKVVQLLTPASPEELTIDLMNVASILASDCSLRETRFKTAGAPVEVISGPLKGVKGELVRLLGTCRLLVRVNFLGKAAELEIDEGFIKTL